MKIPETAPTRATLHQLALAAGWTVTGRRLGKTYYHVPGTHKRAREWLSERACSAGFWFLYAQP